MYWPGPNPQETVGVVFIFVDDDPGVWTSLKTINLVTPITLWKSHAAI